MGARRPLTERFWEKVDKNGPTMPHMSTPCWVWTAARSKDGYGRIGVEYRPREAHSVAWELTHGQQSDGLFTLHRCDNPPCVRPDHLFRGTNTENLRDAASKGRCSGQTMPELYRNNGLRNRKLSDEQVQLIKNRCAAGESQRRVAKAFGVSHQHVSELVRGLWR